MPPTVAATPVQDTAPQPIAEPEPEPQPTVDPAKLPVLNPTIQAARQHAQEAVLAKSQPLQPDLQPLPDGPLPGAALGPEPMPGFFTRLELPAGQNPLANFEQALAELEDGTRKEPVRLAMYGASGTAVDLWTAYMRAYLHKRFGDAGPGMIAPAPHTKWYRHHEFVVSASSLKRHWTKHNSYRHKDPDTKGLFGAMGVAMSAKSKRAYSIIKPSKRSTSALAATTFDFFHLVKPKGGNYIIKVDGKQVAEVKTKTKKRKDPPKLGVHRIEVEAGEHEIRLDIKGNGEVWMLGIAAETGEPGVVVDNFGIDGARIANLKLWDQDLWQEHLRLRDPELYTLHFGTNSAVDEDESMTKYEKDYRAALDMFRAAVPQASCVILGPSDYPKVDGEEISPRPRIGEIRELQRKLAVEYGCAFWDMLKFVGGEGAQTAWVQAELTRKDYLHLTRNGYVRWGIGLTDALMYNYDWSRRSQGDPGTAAKQQNVAPTQVPNSPNSM